MKCIGIHYWSLVCLKMTQRNRDKMIKKMIGLRIFEDENGKTNISLKDVSR